MAKLNSKEWFAATKNGVVLKTDIGWALIGKTKTQVVDELVFEGFDPGTIEIKKIELVIN